MITVDYRDRRPLYQQLIDNIEALIAGGLLAADEQLPSVRQLAVELAINPNTIQRAYAELERQGYIYSVKGRGSFVAENHRIREQKRKEVFEETRRLVEEARAVGITMLELQEQIIQCYGTGTMDPEKRGGNADD